MKPEPLIVDTLEMGHLGKVLRISDKSTPGDFLVGTLEAYLTKKGQVVEVSFRGVDSVIQVQEGNVLEVL